MTLNYRSIYDLRQCIVQGFAKIPKDVDLIVGIPRSGLLVANMIALYRNLPLADLNGFLEGRIVHVGPTRVRPAHVKDVMDCKKVLIVDDSIASGTQMKHARALVEKSMFGCEYMFMAVYATPDSTNKVELFLEIVDRPRIFEWNFFHSFLLTQACFDIDGLLCRDPTAGENDDGPRYQEFLQHTEPLCVPTVPVGFLVTCRLEKYREQTEAWLEKHGVKYERLIMMDLPSKRARQAAGNHAEFKGVIFRNSMKKFFVESSHSQAIQIAQVSGKPAFAMETGRMLYPTAYVASARRWHGRLRRFLMRLQTYTCGTRQLHDAGN